MTMVVMALMWDMMHIGKELRMRDVATEWAR